MLGNLDMMPRIKSFASSRASTSSDPGGDSSTKRAKMDQGSDRKNDAELDSCSIERGATGLEHDMASTSLEGVGHTSRVASIARPPSKSRLHAGSQESKATVVYDYDDKDDEPAIINGNGTEAGHTISTTVGGRNGVPKQTISYMAERVVGTGSFGVVFQARCLETGETVAIKKVLQDKRYKNRELQIMRVLDHPNVLHLKHCFYSTSDKDEVYLNLVLEYVSETVYRASKRYVRMNQHVPTLYVQLYAYQIFRGLNYLHNVVGVCHRDIKPQNLLVNPRVHQLKICDFGSAKKLVPGEPNISYICSRYYRAPELIFGAAEYTTAVDMWSAGCVVAELLLGRPLFQGETGVDQLIEIIKIIGTPTREEIKCMNPNYLEYKFPQIKAHPWHKVFDKRMPPEVVDLVSRLLQYSPKLRCTALEACAHPFFDDLREPTASLPNGRPLPPLFNFTAQELSGASPDLRRMLIPEHAMD